MISLKIACSLHTTIVKVCGGESYFEFGYQTAVCVCVNQLRASTFLYTYMYMYACTCTYKDHTVFPRLNAAATNSFLLLELTATIRGQRLKLLLHI